MVIMFSILHERTRQRKASLLLSKGAIGSLPTFAELPDKYVKKRRNTKMNEDLVSFAAIPFLRGLIVEGV